MSRSTISTFQLFEMFPDQDSARLYLEGLLWPQGPRCPVCGTGDKITAMGAVLELVNERGNEIAIDAKRGPAPDEITLRIVGPLSESTNVVTEQEARAIYRALGHVLDI